MNKYQNQYHKTYHLLNIQNQVSHYNHLLNIKPQLNISLPKKYIIHSKTKNKHLSEKERNRKI